MHGKRQPACGNALALRRAPDRPIEGSNDVRRAPIVLMDKTRCRILANWRRCRYTTSTILKVALTRAAQCQQDLASDMQIAHHDTLVTKDVAALRPLS